jgi:thiol-disulfide isomerase/thioredoxin
MTIAIGSAAPSVGSATPPGPHALLFYKVTCPTCQLAAPALDGFERAYPGRMLGVGQDRAGTLASFSATYAMTFPSVPDLPPYDASNAYGIEHVPTLVVVDGDGRVVDVVESWDRDGLNRASRTLAGLVGTDAAVISDASDGLPAFRPG